MASDTGDNVSSQKEVMDSDWEDEDAVVFSDSDEEADLGRQVRQENTKHIFQRSTIRKRSLYSRLTPQLQGTEPNGILSEKEVKQELLGVLNKEIRMAILRDRFTKRHPNNFSERRYMHSVLDGDGELATQRI